MAIRNIVFDLGRVLIDFDPERYLLSLGCDEKTTAALLQTVFLVDWPRYDRGDYETVDALCDELCRKYPDYASVLRRALTPDWVKIHTLKADTAAYLSALKQRGYRVYLLSNLAKESYDFIGRYPFFREIDGGVFSYQERVCKPDEAIYRVLLERYGLAPEETVFLDDSPANIEAARRLGMCGIVFENLPAARAQLEALLPDGPAALKEDER